MPEKSKQTKTLKTCSLCHKGIFPFTDVTCIRCRRTVCSDCVYYEENQPFFMSILNPSQAICLSCHSASVENRQTVNEINSDWINDFKIKSINFGDYPFYDHIDSLSCKIPIETIDNNLYIYYSYDHVSDIYIRNLDIISFNDIYTPLHIRNAFQRTYFLQLKYKYIPFNLYTPEEEENTQQFFSTILSTSLYIQLLTSPKDPVDAQIVIKERKNDRDMAYPYILTYTILLYIRIALSPSSGLSSYFFLFIVIVFVIGLTWLGLKQNHTLYINKSKHHPHGYLYVKCIGILSSPPTSTSYTPLITTDYSLSPANIKNIKSKNEKEPDSTQVNTLNDTDNNYTYHFNFRLRKSVTLDNKVNDSTNGTVPRVVSTPNITSLSEYDELNSKNSIPSTIIMNTDTQKLSSSSSSQQQLRYRKKASTLSNPLDDQSFPVTSVSLSTMNTLSTRQTMNIEKNKDKSTKIAFIPLSPVLSPIEAKTPIPEEETNMETISKDMKSSLSEVSSIVDSSLKTTTESTSNAVSVSQETHIKKSSSSSLPVLSLSPLEDTVSQSNNTINIVTSGYRMRRATLHALFGNDAVPTTDSPSQDTPSSASSLSSANKPAITINNETLLNAINSHVIQNPVIREEVERLKQQVLAQEYAAMHDVKTLYNNIQEDIQNAESGNTPKKTLIETLMSTNKTVSQNTESISSSTPQLDALKSSERPIKRRSKYITSISNTSNPSLTIKPSINNNNNNNKLNIQSGISMENTATNAATTTTTNASATTNATTVASTSTTNATTAASTSTTTTANASTNNSTNNNNQFSTPFIPGMPMKKHSLLSRNKRK